MEFKHSDGRHCSVVLPQRSLLVMSKEARLFRFSLRVKRALPVHVGYIVILCRYAWTHGITPRKHDVVTTSQVLNDPGAERDEESRLTLAYRETRTSFTFRKVRRGPCHCS